MRGRQRVFAPSKPHSEKGWNPNLNTIEPFSGYTASSRNPSMPYARGLVPLRPLSVLTGDPYHSDDIEGANPSDLIEPRQACLEATTVALAKKANSTNRRHSQQGQSIDPFRRELRPQEFKKPPVPTKFSRGACCEVQRRPAAGQPSDTPYIPEFTPQQRKVFASLPSPTPLKEGAILSVPRPTILTFDMGKIRYTDAQWEDIFQAALQEIPKERPQYPPANIDSPNFAKSVDHTLLKLDATGEDVDRLCAEAVRYGFKSCCVRSNYVQRAVANLQGSEVVVACVIGFHEGNQATDVKVAEAEYAVRNEAAELDMVLNYDLLHSGAYAKVYTDIDSVRAAAPSPVVLKCILETSQLTPSEIVAASLIATEAGVDFVKTSTGFNGPGASVEQVSLMKYVVGGRGIQVKASGGVRSLVDSQRMMQAGATRLGTSSGVAIMNEIQHSLNGGTAEAGEDTIKGEMAY